MADELAERRKQREAAAEPPRIVCPNCGYEWLTSAVVVAASKKGRPKVTALAAEVACARPDCGHEFDLSDFVDGVV